MIRLVEFVRNTAGSVREVVRRLSMPRRWLLTFITLVFLPAIALVYVYNERTASILEEEVTSSMLQTVKQAGNNLSYRLGHIRDISNAASMNQKLNQFLQDDDVPSIGRQLEVLKDLRYLVETVQTNTDVFRMRLFVKNTTMLAEERFNFFSLDSLKSWPFYNKVLDANGAIVWSDIYKQYFIDTGDVYIMSSARLLHDSKQFGQVSAILLIDVSEKLVMEILADLDQAKPNNVFLVDQSGVILAHADKSRIGTSLEGEVQSVIRQGTEGKVKFQLHNKNEYGMFSTIQPTGWKVVLQVSASNISEKVKLKKSAGIATLAGIFAMFLLLVFALLALIIRSMNRRLQQVIGVIREEGIERLDVPHPMPDGNFVMLEHSVDVLIHRVRSLMEQTYKAQVLEREAQLRALQAQINPHFLYNTLDTINWIAIGHGNHDISKMIDSLAKYFRLSLNKGKDVMSVADELNLAQVYLDIQKSRFLNSFEYRIEPDPDVLDYIVPKLTLQPIVENALLHGIRKMKTQFGTILIRAYREENELILIVSDNGIGMEEERAQRLLVEPQLQTRPDGSGSSYGLYNVNERIKLFAGDTSGLSISSRLGAGTSVSVRIRLEPYKQ
ncbi:sensor histidine kinase [Paenibacillus sp. MBLB4367]|uniref:sensor histidine kinase n=1 Tax=Paenibacillus sp. MBLB4367 TaxID=3384767 RepID=UPI003907FE2A